VSQFTHAQENSSNYPWHEEGRGPDPMPSLSAAYPQDAHRAVFWGCVNVRSDLLRNRAQARQTSA
jgi:hypothetical protein